MPRVHAPSAVAGAGDAAAARKTLPSLVEEIDLLLNELSKDMRPSTQATPSVQAWIDAFHHLSSGTSCLLDWSAVPAAVDSSSTAMGLSTAKSEKRRAKKLLKLDMDKVNARAARKRLQVRSWCLPQFPCA